jgi:hypothetical protein
MARPTKPAAEPVQTAAIRKREAKPVELNAIRHLISIAMDTHAPFNDWEVGFIESMEKKLVDAEEFNKNKPCLMLSEKQFATVDKLWIKLANSASEDAVEYFGDRDE